MKAIVHLPLATLMLMASGATAQTPPLTIDWAAHLDYGGREDSSGFPLFTPRPPAPARIQIDQGITYWMAEDSYDAWTIGHGVIRRYDMNGIPLTNYWPEETSIGCVPTLDTPIDLVVRNGAIWEIAKFKDLISAQDSAFCSIAPNNGYYEADETLNGPLLKDGARELLVTGGQWYVCAWHETAPSERNGRILAFGTNNDLLWQTDLPIAQYGDIHTFTELNDSIAVAGFPNVYWLRPSDGAHTSTTVLYNGPGGNGKLVRHGQALYWAVNTGGTIRYGKTDANGNGAWSGTAPGFGINAIAVDGTGALWIGGETPGAGLLVHVASDGTLGSAYPQGATVTDVESDGQRVMWTGRSYPGRPNTYLIVGKIP